MKWRLKRPIGTVEGYESELLNEHNARIATVYLGFNPFPRHASYMADAPEAVEACLLFARAFGEYGTALLDTFEGDSNIRKAFELAGKVARSQRNSLETMLEEDRK